MDKLKNIGRQPYICIWSDKCVVIENLKRVVFYDDEEMILETEFFLRITGKNLKLKYLNNDNVRVDGKIASIEFNVSERRKCTDESL